MSTTVKSPSLSHSSSREANFCTSGRQTPSQQPRGASAFNAPLSDLDLAGTLNPSPSAALMSSSLNDPDPFVSQVEADVRRHLQREPLIPRLANNPTDGALTSTAPAFPTFVPTRIGPPAFTSSFNGGPTNHQLSQALGAASVASVGSGSTGSSRERSRSHSPAREFVRNYLKTTTSSSASVTPTNQSPSVQRLMAMTSTVAQTIRANVASAVNASGAAGATSTGLANAATNLLLGANYGGSNNALHHAAGVDIANSSAATRKQSVMHDRHLLDTSVPDGLADKVASQPSLKPSFSTSTASTDAASSNRQLSSSHLSETLTPANPLAVRRLSCAAPKDKILPSDWPARSDQLALTMDMLLEDTRAIVGEINTSLEAAEQDNLAVGVKLATARTRLRSLVAWEATSTQAVVGWLNMAVSRHKQIEREVKDWGSRPASPRRGLIGEDLAVEEVGLVDSGQSEMEHASKTTNEHSERHAETTAAFELFDQTMTPSDFSLTSRPSPEYSLNASGNSAIVDSSTH
ncbi:hypothetical protein BCR44DRAFT_1511598 [Catenaria anguillulae PL171]|uniref:Uncharacterized protein n=1 Tax=Catenaria anguillulae PL171 TaxID=765915 RepID=A0A1Y2HTP7_9FUNG|nr:hypothetical protein BCR44DRAFT_1511598 [Catenaria anguillulae PL171]